MSLIRASDSLTWPGPAGSAAAAAERGGGCPPDAVALADAPVLARQKNVRAEAPTAPLVGGATADVIARAGSGHSRPRASHLHHRRPLRCTLKLSLFLCWSAQVDLSRFFYPRRTLREPRGSFLKES